MATTAVSPNQRSAANKITRQIAQALDKLGGDYAEATRLIKVAVDQEVWVALGKTKEQWITDNFAGVIANYSTELRRSLGTQLKNEIPALTTRDLSALAGISQSTATRDLNDDVRKRANNGNRKRKSRDDSEDDQGDDRVIPGEVAETIVCSHGCPVHCPTEE